MVVVSIVITDGLTSIGARSSVVGTLNPIYPDQNLKYGYAPVIRMKMAISGRHAHFHADKTGILDGQILSHWYHFEAQRMGNNI